MNKFQHVGDETKPTVLLDPYEQILKIEGRSILENAAEFYLPVLNWMTEYLKTPFEETTLEINLKYINTSSSKCLVDIFHSLEPLVKENKDVKVKWHYHQDDEDLEETGEDFKAVVKVPFVLCPHT